jgi:hypothetical protein
MLTVIAANTIFSQASARHGVLPPYLDSPKGLLVRSRSMSPAVVVLMVAVLNSGLADGLPQDRGRNLGRVGGILMC